MQLSACSWAAPLAVLFAGCSDAPLAFTPLPVATLLCPAHVIAGDPFVVDGSASTGAIASHTLSVGDAQQDDVKGVFVVDVAGVSTARLVVKDAAGNVAEARCRIVVDAGEGSVTPPPPDPLPHGDPVDITGSFAMVAYDAPILDDASLDPAHQCADAPVLALVDFAQTARHVSMTLRWCSIAMPAVQTASNGVQQATWTPAVVDALLDIGPVEFDLERAETGAIFAPPMDALGVADVVGARLDDEDGALPSDWNDPRLSDDDGDGWPAVTVNADTGVEDIVYRRYVRAMSGTIVSSDVVDGSAAGSWRVDADAGVVSFAQLSLPIGAGRPSTFHMDRVDPATTCDDVRAALDQLVTAFPPLASPADCPSF